MVPVRSPLGTRTNILRTSSIIPPDQLLSLISPLIFYGNNTTVLGKGQSTRRTTDEGNEIAQ